MLNPVLKKRQALTGSIGQKQECYSFSLFLHSLFVHQFATSSVFKSSILKIFIRTE